MINALGAWNLHPGAGLSGRQIPLRSIISEELCGKYLGQDRQSWHLDKQLQFFFAYLFGGLLFIFAIHVDRAI